MNETITRSPKQDTTSPASQFDSTALMSDSFQQFQVISEIIKGLRDQRNVDGASFLALVEGQFGEQIKGFGDHVTGPSILRELENKSLLEVRSYDARKAREAPVWNLTPVGAVWNSIFEQAHANGGDGGGADLGATLVTLNTLAEDRSLIDYSQIDIESSLLFLRRHRLIDMTPSVGYHLTNSPLVDLI